MSVTNLKFWCLQYTLEFLCPSHWVVVARWPELSKTNVSSTKQRLKQSSSISTDLSMTQCHNKTSMFIVYCKTPYIFKKWKLYWVHMSLYRCIKSIFDSTTTSINYFQLLEICHFWTYYLPFGWVVSKLS